MADGVTEGRTTADKLARLRALEVSARLGGGEARLRQQHARGKLTARERLELLLDEGTFQELDAFVTHRTTEFGLAEQRYLGDGDVTGYGRIEWREVHVYSQYIVV